MTDRFAARQGSNVKMARKLSRESIVDAALEQVHRGEPVSSAGIAETLGVRVPSLYHHIDHLEHLRTLVENRLHDEMAASVDPMLPGRPRSDRSRGRRERTLPATRTTSCD